MMGTLVVKGLNTLVFNLNTTKDFISTSGRVRINVNILNHEKNIPIGHKILAISAKLFAFHNAITTCHYLRRNQKFSMETVN